MRVAREPEVCREQKEQREVMSELRENAESSEAADIRTALEIMRLSSEVRRRFAVRLLREQAYRRLPESR